MKATRPMLAAVLALAVLGGCSKANDSSRGDGPVSASKADTPAAKDDASTTTDTADTGSETTARKQAEAPLALTGTWERACYALPAAAGAEPSYRIDTIMFKDKTYETREREFEDSACTTLLVELRAVGGYKVGARIAALKETAEFDMTPQQAFVTVTTDEGVAVFNAVAQQQKCNVTFVKDEEQDFAACLPMKPVFSIIKATATKLYTAAASAAAKDAQAVKDGSTAAKRPVALAKTGYTKAAAKSSVKAEAADTASTAE